MYRSFFKAATVAVGAFVTLSAATANAQFANTLNVVGQTRFSSGAGGSPLLIDFLSGNAFPPSTPGNGTPGNVFSGATTGAFTSIPGGSNGVIQDLTSTGGVTTTNPAGNTAAFMTIGGYTFSLTSVPAGASVGPLTVTDQSGGAIASFSTFGIVSGGSFVTPLTYQGLFTAQFVGLTAAQALAQINSTAGTPVVTFSANFGAPVGAAVVPEPSTYALLATGLGALGFAVRRRRAQV